CFVVITGSFAPLLAQRRHLRGGLSPSNHVLLAQKKFIYNYKNIRWAKGRNQTYLCFVVKRRLGPNSLSFDFGHLHNRTGCHVEDPKILRQCAENIRISYSVTWFCSWSPCANCAATLAQLLRQTPNLRLRIFVARLYFCDLDDNYFYCWQTFVARRLSRFKAWEGLHTNYVHLSRKLNRILQPCETEDLRDAFRLIGLLT
ncbi:hypothetical protein CRUP_006703, partial [Coryphaenoides rupestris]